MGKGKSSGRGGVKYGAGRGGGKYSPPKYSPPKYGGGRPSGGGKYSPQDTVAVILKRETAEDLLNALIIALASCRVRGRKAKAKRKTAAERSIPRRNQPIPGSQPAQRRMAVNRPAAKRIASSQPEPSPGAVSRSLRAAASMAAASELRIPGAVNGPAPAPQVALDCDSQQRANGRPFLAGSFILRQ